MLQRTFAFVSLPELRDVVLALLARAASIPAPMLASLAANNHLYSSCPLPVRRHVWSHSPDVFRREAFPLLDALIAESNPREPLYDLLHDDSTPAPAERRAQCAPLQRLLEMVGSSTDLYKLLLATARTLFTSTKNDRFCALRADALMAMHDAQLSAVYDADPCHALAWCIDACARDGRVDERLLAEMSQYVDAVATEIKTKQNLRVRFTKPDIKVRIPIVKNVIKIPTAVAVAAGVPSVDSTDKVGADVAADEIEELEAQQPEEPPPPPPPEPTTTAATTTSTTTSKFKISKQALAAIAASSKAKPIVKEEVKKEVKADPVPVAVVAEPVAEDIPAQDAPEITLSKARSPVKAEAQSNKKRPTSQPATSSKKRARKDNNDDDDDDVDVDDDEDASIDDADDSISADEEDDFSDDAGADDESFSDDGKKKQQKKARAASTVRRKRSVFARGAASAAAARGGRARGGKAAAKLRADAAAAAAASAGSTKAITVADEKERMIVLADMALILRSPPAMAALVREIFNRVELCVSEQKMPAEDAMLPRLTPLALLAIRARPLLAGEQKTPPPPEETNEMVQSFYALLAERIVDDRVRLLSNQSSNAATPAPPLPQKLAKLLHRNELARKVLLYYALQRALADDASGLDAVVEVFQRKLGDGVKKELPFAQSIVSALLAVPQHSAALRHVVMEKFLLQHVRNHRSDPKAVCHRQMLRYLLQAHARLPITTLLGYVHVGITGEAHTALTASLVLDGGGEREGKQRQRAPSDTEVLSGELARALAPLYEELWQRVRERAQIRREAAFWIEWLELVRNNGEHQQQQQQQQQQQEQEQQQQEEEVATIAETVEETNNMVETETAGDQNENEVQ